jgi:hypothetical protein
MDAWIGEMILISKPYEEAEGGLQKTTRKGRRRRPARPLVHEHSVPGSRLHRLDLRFAGARVAEPRAVERIARSIECGGQIVPCIAVADPPVEVLEGGERLVLIDGYRRIAALRRLGRDTARIECWACDLAETVLGVLARTGPLRRLKKRCWFVNWCRAWGCRSTRLPAAAGAMSAGSADDCNCSRGFPTRFLLRFL